MYAWIQMAFIPFVMSYKIVQWGSGYLEWLAHGCSTLPQPCSHINIGNCQTSGPSSPVLTTLNGVAFQHFKWESVSVLTRNSREKAVYFTKQLGVIGSSPMAASANKRLYKQPPRDIHYPDTYYPAKK